jgi:hypothetical protein
MSSFADRGSESTYSNTSGNTIRGWAVAQCLFDMTDEPMGAESMICVYDNNYGQSAVNMLVPGTATFTGRGSCRKGLMGTSAVGEGSSRRPQSEWCGKG